MKLLVMILLCAFLKPSLCKYHVRNNFEKSGSILTQSTQVAALGRVADLGDLYDARTDNFIEISLYTTDLSGDAIHTTDNPYSSIDYVKTESFSEKTKKLGVQASLSISVLANLVDISGSGKYLSDEKQSYKSAKTSLIYSISTVREDLKIFSKNSRNLIDNFLVENIDATHVVVGIDWGANVVLSMEEINTDSSNVKELQAKLNAGLHLIALSVSGGAEVDFGSSDIEQNSTFSLHINGDIIPDIVPQTINESIAFIRDIPDLIKSENGGKGKIINYILMPLPTVQKVFQLESNKSNIVRDIEQELIDQFMKIFEEIKDSQLQVNDVYNDINTWNLMVPESEFISISEIKSQFDAFSNNLRVEFAELIVKFRNGQLDDEALKELISSYEGSDWTSAEIKKLLNDFTPTINKIQLLNLFENFGAYFIDRRTNKYKILTDNYKEEIRIVSLDLSIDVSSPYVHSIVELLEQEAGKESEGIRYYIEELNIDIPEVSSYLRGTVINKFAVDKKEYFLLSNVAGKGMIMDANSYNVISYFELPRSYSSTAVVGTTFYNIKTFDGMIMSTSMEDIITAQEANWTLVGSFPPSDCGNINGAVVNDTDIYFDTCYGFLYRYNTILKTVTELHKFNGNDLYSSLTIVQNILYISQARMLYSYDGNIFKGIETPEKRDGFGLFSLGSNVCLVGGNLTDIKPDPVYCYDPDEKLWSIHSHINQARQWPGVVKTQLGIYIFGGKLVYADSSDEGWLDSVEMLYSDSKVWSYTPIPLTDMSGEIMQVTSFFLLN